jgi:hypothetical protein
MAVMAALLLGLVLAAGWVRGSESEDPAGEDLRLKQFLQQAKGLWAEEGYVLGLRAGQLLQEQATGLTLDIRPERIAAGRAQIFVSDFCRPELADYLLFRLEDGVLVYEGASLAGCSFDISWIGEMRIRKLTEGGETVLLYEMQDADAGEWTRERLRRLPEGPQASAWHCQMQSALIRLLQQPGSQIFDSAGRALSPEEAFGSASLMDELAYLDRYSLFWPLFEEVCVRAPFEVVIIGALHPGGSAEVYAIEWDSEEVRLYETHSAEESEDGYFPLKRGALRFRILPPGQGGPLSPSLQ